MANALGLYDPLFYAQEGIIQLKKALGMAARVYRGFDRTPQERGSTIMINKPSTFVAQDAPSTAQDIAPGQTSMTLAFWKEVKFFLTDKELTFSGERIINDHIVPAARALALDVDTRLFGLAEDIPWFVDTTAPAAVSDITAARKVLFSNGVPMDENDLFLGVDPQLESEFLALPAFSQASGAGDVGVNTQLRGTIGTKFGFNVFASQNVPTHVAGVSADAVGALTATANAGATQISFNAVTASGTFKRGDSFVLAGNTQRYVFAADATADGTGLVTNASVFPPLVQTYNSGVVITASLLNHVKNMAFHRSAFALAMAPLSRLGAELGAKIETAVDEDSGLAIRSRMFYVGDASRVYVALDILYGLKTLEPNAAVILRD